MRKKNIIILVIVFAALIGVYMILNYLTEKSLQRQQQEEEDQNIQVTDFDADQVTSFSYLYNKEELKFEKQDDQWVCQNEPDTDLDEDAVNSLLDTLGDISTASEITSPEDISEYGFDNLNQKAVINLDDGSSIELSFGAENTISGGYYMQMSGDDNVYLVDSSLVTDTLGSGTDTLKAADTDSSEEESTEDGSAAED